MIDLENCNFNLFCDYAIIIECVYLVASGYVSKLFCAECKVSRDHNKQHRRRKERCFEGTCTDNLITMFANKLSIITE